jgi:5'-nucleotidase
LVLFSGDLCGPSMTSALTKGRHMISVLDELGTDYGCFGNHEFDFGLESLNSILYDQQNKYGLHTEPSKTRWISTNIDGRDHRPIAGSSKSVLVNWHGVKVRPCTQSCRPARAESCKT